MREIIPRQDAFREAYIGEGGSPRAASSYLTYLRKLDRACDGIDRFLHRSSVHELVDWCNRQPSATFGSNKDRTNVCSAVARYARFMAQVPLPPRPITTNEPSPENVRRSDEVTALLREAKSLGARYYQVTGKPLGVTAEVAELEAADKLGLTLCPPRTPLYDAIDRDTGARVQIKGKAVDLKDPYRGMCSAIKCGTTFVEAYEVVVLVLLDKATLECFEIWAAGQLSVANRAAGLVSDRRRTSCTLAVTQFKSIADRVWPPTA